MQFNIQWNPWNRSSQLYRSLTGSFIYILLFPNCMEPETSLKTPCFNLYCICCYIYIVSNMLSRISTLYITTLSRYIWVCKLKFYVSLWRYNLVHIHFCLPRLHLALESVCLSVCLPQFTRRIHILSTTLLCKSSYTNVCSQNYDCIYILMFLLLIIEFGPAKHISQFII